MCLKRLALILDLNRIHRCSTEVRRKVLCRNISHFRRKDAPRVTSPRHKLCFPNNYIHLQTNRLHSALTCVSCNRNRTENGSGLLIQTRCISIETYNRYFSPDVPPLGFAQEVLEKFHSLTGLPWWASIGLTTFTLRMLITLPLSVYSMQILAKVEMLQPEVKTLSNELRKEVAMAVKKFGWDEKKARSQYNSTMRKLIHDLYVRDNCHPFKSSLVLWCQIPMWICMSFALRNMSGAVPVLGLDTPVMCPDLQTEGALWFTDLTITDSTWILPVLMGMLNLMNVEIHTLQRTNPVKFQRIIMNVLRVVSVIMIPIGAAVPSSMCFYWTCSSLFGLVQNVAFKVPRVKRALRIPKTPSESTTPFKDMADVARTKYLRKQ